MQKHVSIVNIILKILLILFVLTVIIVSIYLAIYFTVVKPNKDREQEYFEQQVIGLEKAAEEEDARQQELRRQSDLNNCLDVAQDTYEDNWEIACKSNAKQVRQGYKNCVADPYLDSSYCRSLWGYPDSSKDCSLPKDLAKGLDSYRKELKEECYKKYPQ